MHDKIHKRIEEDIDRIKLIRVSRIKTAKRLEKYDNSWKIILLVYNIEAVISVLVGFIHTNKLTPLISGIVSISVILLQDFVAGRDYKNRSSNLNYQQLGMKNIILKLQELSLCDDNLEKKYLLNKYSDICNEYQAILLGYENHDDLDFVNAKIELDLIEETERKDFSLENIFIWIQPIIIIIFFILILLV